MTRGFRTLAKGATWEWTAIVLLTLLLRWPALTHPGPIDDEGVYAAVANVLVDGGLPYRDAVERKPPVLFWVYQACFSAAGKSAWPALHALGVLWILGTMLALHVLVRSLFDARAGRWAALLYSIFMTWGAWKCLAFNGELMMNLPLVWAAVLVLATRGGARWRRWLASFGAGALLGAAVLTKQPAGITIVPLGLYLLLQPSHSLGARLAHAMLLGAGFAGFIAVVTVRLWTWGVLSDALYWAVGDHDIPHGPTSAIFWKLAVERGLLWFVGGALGLIGLAVLSIRWRGRQRGLWRDREPEFWTLGGAVVAAVIGAAWSGRFYPHYFLQVVPWLCALAAPACSHLLAQHTKARRTTLAVVFAHAAIYFAINAVSFAGMRNPSQLASWIRSASAPQDKILVWGQSASVYALSGRSPSTRYITTFPLTGYIFGSPLTRDRGHDTSQRILPGAWETLQNELCARPPALIIDTEATRTVPRYPAANFPRLWHWVTASYAEAFRTREGVGYRRVAPPRFCEPSSIPITTPTPPPRQLASLGLSPAWPVVDWAAQRAKVTATPSFANSFMRTLSPGPSL
jgi:4-amino-4-deoxy-L-arabinose transferase-like glycosyltransferase